MNTTPLAFSEFDHIFVMDDLVADIDRRAVDLQRHLDDIDSAHHAGAKAARRAKNDAELVASCRHGLGDCGKSVMSLAPPHAKSRTLSFATGIAAERALYGRPPRKMPGLSPLTAARPRRPSPPAPIFTTGSLMRHVVVMTATGSIGLIAIFSVDVLSLFWVSRLGVESFKAAIGYAGQAFFLLMSINIGLTIAISATVSRALGAGDRPRARRLAASGLSSPAARRRLRRRARRLPRLSVARYHARARPGRRRREPTAAHHHPRQRADGRRHGACRAFCERWAMRAAPCM